MKLEEQAGQILRKLREREQYTVHCIVGSVAEAFTAETLQAINLAASMTHDIREVGDFVGSAQALMVQLGPLSELKEAGMMSAIDTARRQGKPWILDPRSADRSVYRTELARSLGENRPRIICGKSYELASMMRSKSAVDATTVAKFFKATVVECGSPDIVVDSLRQANISVNSKLMDNVNAMSSALAAICAAFASIESDGFKAASAAMLFARTAGERASIGARGVGSFMINFLDEISTMTPADLATSSSRDLEDA